MAEQRISWPIRRIVIANRGEIAVHTIAAQVGIPLAARERPRRSWDRSDCVAASESRRKAA